MQFINEQYKVVKVKSYDSYGTTYVVEDIQKGNLLKHLRIISLQNETRDFIEYMKNNFYDHSMYIHPNIIAFHFFNKIRLIDYKQITVNQYYYTYDYFEGVNAMDYCKGKDLDTILDLVGKLCATIKYLHLRGFLLCCIDINDLQVVHDDKGDCLKIASMPYPEKTSRKVMIGKDSACIKDPAILKKNDYSIQSDIYLIGAIIFYLFSGLNTSHEKFQSDLSISDLKDNNTINKKIMSIIKKCTTADLSEKFQSVDDIILNINDCFDKQYSIIEKQYIQAMPQFRIKPVARYHIIDKVLNNAKGHFFVGRPNKVSLIVGPEGSGKSDFLEALSVKVEHEGFIPIKTILNESDLMRFSLLEVFVKSITKYVDKELIDKYIGDLNNVVSLISRYRAIPSNADVNSPREDSRGKFIQRISNFIAEASNRFHFIFIIDNFQWIDEDSLELVDEILKGQNSSKTYVVFATDKDTFSQSIEVKEYCSKLKETYSLDSIKLKNFSLEDTAEYIRLVLGMGKPNYKFAKIIHDKSKGSPEYIYDTIYMLYSNNNIYVDDKGSWVLDKVDYESLNLSYADDIDTLNNVYKLNANYRDLLKILSVFNISVSSDIVENFVEAKEEKLVSQLNYLSYINIIVRKQNDWGISYSFSSMNLKKSIYESIPVQLRQKYHEKASYILKSKFSRENRENEDELIHQMLRANWHLEVKQYLMNSANEMIEENSLGQAIQFLEHAYSLFSSEKIIGESELICTKLGELYEQIGDYSKAIFYYNIVEKAAKNTKNHYLMIDIYIKKYSLLYKLNDKETSLKYLAWAKKLLKSTDYKKGMYEHIIAINRMMLHKRKFSTYIKILENTINSMDKEEYKFQYARLLGVYGRFKAYKGRYEEGLASLTEGLRILESMGNFRKMLYPLNSMGSIYYNCYNDIQKAREYYEKCLSISQRVSDMYYVGISYNNVAEQYRMEDKYTEALQYYQNSLENITQIKDKYAEFLIFLNIALVNIDIEDYKKALAMQNDMEVDFTNSKYSGNLMDLFHQCRAEFYYSIGDYIKAGEYAQKSIDTCISWGIAENHEAHFVKLLSEIQLSGRLDYERDRVFLDTVFGENLYKLGRTACVKLAEIYISKGMRDRAKELLQRGLSYVSNIDTDMLKLRYEYVGVLVKDGFERLGGLTKLAGLIEAVENNEIKWKIYKAIATELVDQKNYREALKYLITSLNYLRKLVYNVPDEYKVRFINSHERNSVKESLSRVAELLTSNKPRVANTKTHIIGKRLLSEQRVGLSLHEIDKYFDYTEYRDIYRHKETDETDSSIDASTDVKFLGKMQELVGRFSEDETTNLKHMIDLFAEITQAKNAFIATLQEDDSLNIIASYNRYSEVPFYKYVIEQVKQKKDSIIVNDTFEYNARKGDILIPKDITAVFCIPVVIAEENDSIELMEERRRYREQGSNTIIGYIYLDTDSIINNFTQESSRFCMIASKIAYVLVDNYNMKIVSTVDKLTKLYTRKYFESALANELMYVEKEGGQFSIIMADIDKFKSVNDRFGHQKGDEVLQSISGIIMSGVRKGDVCGRYGGEEIIILLPGTDSEGAYSVAEKIRKKIENAKLLGLNTPLTISMGVSSYPEHGTWAKDLIDKADQALYHVKELGRNASRIYEPNMSKNIKRIDRLAGIISGDLVEDQRKVETMLEILELQRESEKTLEEKMFSFLGRIIEVSEAQAGGIFYIDETEEGECSISRKLLRKKLVDREVDETYYNEGIVLKCMESKAGEYQIDWSGYPGIDPLTGMPDWQSVIAVPMIDRGRLKGVAYLSVSIKNKEFDAGTYNYVKTLSDIMTAAL
jgi:diguanylate cyclase (GGDEF)-like protein